MLAKLAPVASETISSNFGTHRHWVASLDLGFSRSLANTRLETMKFEGPLRVQRPFYPEEDGTCHCYILHPPGGMVSGDRLSMQVNTAVDARALVTTPSAGKVYGTDSHNLPQQQCISLSADKDSSLEFLPQETIIFDSARAELNTHIALTDNARLFYWDMITLGRQAGDAPFKSGSFKQALRIERDGLPLVLEHFDLQAGSALQHNAAGLMGYECFGSCYVSGNAIETQVEALREHLETLSGLDIFVTHKPDILIVRAMAHDTEILRNAFIRVWQCLRPLLLDKPAHEPRIWST